jgi:hypothetical protein
MLMGRRRDAMPYISLKFNRFMNQTELRCWTESIKFNLYSGKVRFILDDSKNTEPHAVMAHYIIVEKRGLLFKIEAVSNSIRIIQVPGNFLENLKL